ncbi:MAG: lipopolysaccharide biosynthesis protein [Micavibrio aeruginosavorus]|uniref:Lipopolysaccharide biosynthesis protein n=1 Tax=Micavibrio aeruginosavorus TaxID=349221 RepID=A0A2W5FDP6_9BACT|nr:MAG: lipopolysaccharide biosynthesis protein [Micavibrio aeruginosavorus]
MLETIIDRKELKSKSVSGAAISLATQMVKLCLLFGNQIVMARFLTPADFGLVAMVTPVMAFVVLFADMGLSQATIQRPKIAQDELSFLFWVNVGVASLLAVIFMAMSPVIGMFYGEPRVIKIALVMGASLILSGLTIQHTSIMTRRMEFKKQSFLDIGSLVVGFACGILAASIGMDYWSLVVIHVMIYVTNMTGAWALSGWRPSWPTLPGEWKELLGFGGNLSGFNFVNYFARNLDNVLIGRYSGEVALGLYDRAYKLLLMPLTQITQPFARIALPILSRTQDEPNTYKRAYLRMVEVIMLATYPGVLFAIIDHDNLIRTVLGDKWAGVGPIFAILGLASFLGTISHTTGWLFISQNRTRDMRNWGVLSSGVIIASFVAGLPWGPIGVATAYLAVTTIQGPILWWAVTRKGPVSFIDILRMLIPFAFASAITAVLIYMLVLYVMPKGPLAILVLLPLSYMVFAAAFFILPSGRIVLIDLFNHVIAMVRPFMAKFKSRPLKVEDEPL